MSMVVTRPSTVTSVAEAVENIEPRPTPPYFFVFKEGFKIHTSGVEDRYPVL